MRSLFSKRYFFTSVVSVLLSVLAVAVVSYGASLVDTNTVGVGTTTVGAAVGVRGAGIFDGFVSADYFTSTSTNPSWHLGRLGLGTTTPSPTVNADGGIAVEGGGLFGDFVLSSYLTATSTTATSTIRTGVIIASSTIGDVQSGAIAIGATSTSDGDVAGTFSVDPSLSVFGVGSAANATGTLYVSNSAATGGGQIILKSTDATGCVSITATRGTAIPQGGVGLTVKAVACPK